MSKFIKSRENFIVFCNIHTIFAIFLAFNLVSPALSLTTTQTVVFQEVTEHERRAIDQVIGALSNDYQYKYLYETYPLIFYRMCMESEEEFCPTAIIETDSMEVDLIIILDLPETFDIQQNSAKPCSQCEFGMTYAFIYQDETIRHLHINPEFVSVD